MCRLEACGEKTLDWALNTNNQLLLEIKISTDVVASPDNGPQQINGKASYFICYDVNGYTMLL